MIKKYLNSGLSVIPITKGAKFPAVKWEIYQQRIATEVEAETWSIPIGIVGGKVSGGLICIDFDNKGSHFIPWMDLVQFQKPELAMLLTIQQTPSGGYHAIYRCLDAIMGNEKLARLAKPDAEGKSILIETRGEGGQFLAYPSEGYNIIQNDFFNIPILSLEDHDFLISCARSFNQYLKDETSIPAMVQEIRRIEGVRPGEDYDSKNTPMDLLIKHGWVIAFERNEAVYLKRPGTKNDVSASWNYIPGRFWCWSSSTVFENEKTYKPWHVYAMLEHNGNYSNAAKELYNQGYGSREITKKNNVYDEKVSITLLKICRAKDFHKDVTRLRNNGMPTGYPTGFKTLDHYYKVARGQLNIVTGIPSSGKSEVMDAIMINMAKESRWKFIVFSPENYPLEFHFKKLAEKYNNKYFNNLTEDEIENTIQFINDHFYFIPATESNITLSSILATVESIVDKEKIDGLLIDPWNEVEVDMNDSENETLYIGRALTTIRKFSRKHNIATWIVAHPTKMRKEKQQDGKWEYPIPDLYSISGSANWYNKADNGLVIWRDFEAGYTKIIIQKIKFKYYGTLGEIKIFYQPESGNYKEEETTNNGYNERGF